MYKMYVLPKLNYGYDELKPFLSEEQLKIHHQKHHQSYVDGANKILAKLTEARKSNEEIDSKGVLKDLSFQVGGFVLHDLYWKNLTSNGPQRPNGKLLKQILEDFGSCEEFKSEFKKSAMSIEGSGWAVLAVRPETKELYIGQIEKHNTNLYPNYPIVLVLDMFEHAYYIDYKNDKKKYVDASCDFINWQEVERRFEKV